MTKKIIDRLFKIAQASFDFNHRVGRRGKEWALESEVEYQAAKRILELEAALVPFAKYFENGLIGARNDTLVVGIYGRNRNDEPDGIELLAKHFKKADTLLRKK